MTFIEKFEEIKKKIGTPDTSKLAEDFAVQVNMTDLDCCGAFYVAYRNGELAIEPYDYHDHTAMINVLSKDLIDAMTGKLDPLAAVMAGKIEVFGNLDHVKAIMTLKKKPAKRTTAAKAKTAVKKTAEKAEKAVKATAMKAAPAVKKAETAVKETAKKAETAVKKAAKKSK